EGKRGIAKRGAEAAYRGERGGRIRQYRRGGVHEARRGGDEYAGSAGRNDGGFCVDAADGSGAAAERGRSAGTIGEMEKLGPGSAGRNRRVGENAGPCGFRADRASGGATRERFSDEGDLYGRGAGGGRGGERIKGGVPRNEGAS